MRSLLLSFILVQGVWAHAFDVQPDSIRETLLKNNVQIQIGLNGVARAKEEVRLARTQLIPSLNLGTALTLVNPSFALGSVEALLPFLVPSNWSNLKRSKKIFQAEFEGYRALKLNLLASSLSLYYAMLSDARVLELSQSSLKHFDELKNLLELESAALGSVTSDLLSQARSRVAMAQLQVSQMTGLIEENRATLRQILGLSLDEAIDLVQFEMPRVVDEDRLSVQENLDRVLANAPESLQLASLLMSARAGRMSEVFGFFSGASLGFRPNDQSFSISSLGVNGGFSIGTSTIPRVRISNRNIAELELRVIELRQEMCAALETSIQGLRRAKEQYGFAESAEKDGLHVAEMELFRYRLGMSPLDRVVEARLNAQAASQAKVSAWQDLQLQRVSLHRVFMSDQFSKI